MSCTRGGAKRREREGSVYRPHIASHTGKKPPIEGGVRDG